MISEMNKKKDDPESIVRAFEGCRKNRESAGMPPLNLQISAAAQYCEGDGPPFPPTAGARQPVATPPPVLQASASSNEDAAKAQKDRAEADAKAHAAAAEKAKRDKAARLAAEKRAEDLQAARLAAEKQAADVEAAARLAAVKQVPDGLALQKAESLPSASTWVPSPNRHVNIVSDKCDADEPPLAQQSPPYTAEQQAPDVLQASGSSNEGAARAAQKDRAEAAALAAAAVEAKRDEAAQLAAEKQAADVGAGKRAADVLALQKAESLPSVSMWVPSPNGRDADEPPLAQQSLPRSVRAHLITLLILTLKYTPCSIFAGRLVYL